MSSEYDHQATVVKSRRADNKFKEIIELFKYFKPMVYNLEMAHGDSGDKGNFSPERNTHKKHPGAILTPTVRRQRCGNC